MRSSSLPCCRPPAIAPCEGSSASTPSLPPPRPPTSPPSPTTGPRGPTASRPWRNNLLLLPALCPARAGSVEFSLEGHGRDVRVRQPRKQRAPPMSTNQQQLDRL